MKKFIFLILLLLSPKVLMAENLETTTLAGGCFWCLEAVYQDLNGVEKVVSGYSGGRIKNPGYEEVSSGATGHAEAVQITFNSQIISFKDLLDIFFHLHDPTTLNRQGADIGSQYRSAIFYNNEKQKNEALETIKKLEEEKLYSDKFVTEVVPFSIFYPAEDYHQNYFKNNPKNRYCQLVVAEKVAKTKNLYKDKFKNLSH